MQGSPHPFRPTAAVAHALLGAAARAIAADDREQARTALTSAVVVDSTPASRYALAEFLTESGQAAAAISQLELAWDTAKALASPAWRARCCHALADLHRTLQHVDLANRYRQWAVQAELDGGSDVDVSTWLHDRAEDRLREGDAETALQLAAAAERTAPAGSAGGATVRRDCLRGAACVQAGRWAQGVRWFVRAFHAARQEHDLRGCSLAALNVAQVLWTRGAWQRAGVCFDHAARLLRRLHDEPSASNAARRGAECRRLWAALHGDPLRN